MKGVALRDLPDGLFPEPIISLLQSFSKAGFFDQSVLIGSWAMPIYRELYGVEYILRTLDLDFAVQTAPWKARDRTNLDELICGLGFTSFFAEEGLQKYTAGGYEVEFFVHRPGGVSEEARVIHEWGITALTLPFLSMLLDHSETGALKGESILRFPIPEAFFLHKLIISQRRRKKEKKEKDLEQCAAMVNVLDRTQLRHVLESQRLGTKTRKTMEKSCEAIGFPLQDLISREM